MKLLAKELEVPIVAIAQLNRGAEQRTDKRPMLSDLRESGSLEQDSDVVILLHRDDAYDRDSTRPGEADLIVHHIDKSDPRLEFIELGNVRIVPVVAPGFLSFPVSRAITPERMRNYVQCVIRDTARHAQPRSRVRGAL